MIGAFLQARAQPSTLRMRPVDTISPVPISRRRKQVTAAGMMYEQQMDGPACWRF